jgi:hypothetical protein
MAESQDGFEYDADMLDTLIEELSPARWTFYLDYCHGDRDFAAKVYLWNARLAKSLLFPLHVAEVTARNAINRAIIASFKDDDWLLRPVCPVALSIESKNTLKKCKERLTRRGLNFDNNDVVAALTFDFWSVGKRNWRDSLARNSLTITQKIM